MAQQIRPNLPLRAIVSLAKGVTVAGLLVVLPAAHAQTTSLPYIEDFESGPGDFQALGVDNPWEWGVVDNSFATEGSSGERAWYTGLSELLTPDSPGILESPEFDFTDRTSDPTLQFSQSRRLPYYAEVWVSMSVDGGPFERLGAPAHPDSLAWYNEVEDQSWQGDLGAANQWTLTRHPLEGSAGHRVRLRFELGALPYLGSWTAWQNEGFGIDDFAIYEELDELRLVSIELPEPSADLGLEPLSLIIWNLGTQPSTQVQATLTITGPNSLIDTQSYSIGLQPTKKTFLHWPTPIDFSLPGSYSIEASIQSAGDSITSNNFESEVLVHQSIVDAFPFFTDFSAGPGDFAPSLGASLSSWSWDTVTSEDFAPVAGGHPTWSTHPSGELLEGELSYLQSPQLDFSNFVNDATLEFTQVREMLLSDSYFKVSLSIDGGPFEVVGWPIKDPLAALWYTSLKGWQNNTGAPIDWQTNRHVLVGTAGKQAVVRFEIDSNSFNSSYGEGVAIRDVLIYETAYGPGQPADKFRSMLDINEARDVLGYPVDWEAPGPFFTEASPASDFELSLVGAKSAPVIVYVGQLTPGLLELPEVGIVDLTEISIFGSGLLTGGLNPFFVTNASSKLGLDLSVSPALAGLKLAFQAVTLDSELVPKLTNSVEVTFTADA